MQFRFGAVGVCILLLGTVAVAGDNSSVQGDSVQCADETGAWTFPDGLILGGPDGNQESEPYRTWIASCDFEVRVFEETVYTPYAEALLMWEGCMSSSEEPIPSPSHQLDECGPAPLPTDALPNGTIPMQLEVVHKGTPHGSVQYSTYIYKTAAYTYKADPVNLFFYGNGQPTLVASKLQLYSGWVTTTNHHPSNFNCSSDKYVRIDDAVHGGTNAWQLQRNMQELQSGSPHTSGSCEEQRFHIRYFGAGPTDNHSPSFGRYLPSAVHHELDGHNDPGVSPNLGRNQIQSDVTGKPWVGSFTLLYIGNTNCNTCALHDGYELNVRVL